MSEAAKVLGVFALTGALVGGLFGGITRMDGSEAKLFVLIIGVGITMLAAFVLVLVGAVYRQDGRL